jgi:hypothetical protein
MTMGRIIMKKLTSPTTAIAKGLFQASNPSEDLRMQRKNTIPVGETLQFVTDDGDYVDVIWQNSEWSIPKADWDSAEPVTP